MARHTVPQSTHTVELTQLAELNEVLGADPRPVVSASDLGLAGATTRPQVQGGLAGSAVLLRLTWDGPPEFPYIYGSFSSGSSGTYVVDLHTAHLKQLCGLLSLHQKWGF